MRRTRHGERVAVLTYEELVREPEATMRRLAERIGIEMSRRSCWCRRSTAGRSGRTRATPVAGYGILAERGDAYRDLLDPAVVARIDELAGGLYEDIRALGRV